MELLRHTHNDQIKVYLRKVAELFTTLSDRGLMGLNALIETKFITEQNNAIVFLFRNFLACLDSIPSIVLVPSPEALHILARTIFELRCYLSYIVKENVNERAIAYQVYFTRARIKTYERFDPDTNAGKEFRAKWDKDESFSKIPQISVDTKPGIENLKKQLSTSPYREVDEKIAQISGKKDWYTFDTGKKDLVNLCEYLGDQMLYEFFYRQWSGTVHSSTVYEGNIFEIGGEGAILAIRSTTGIQSASTILATLVTKFYLDFFQRTVPEFHQRQLIYMKNQYIRMKADIDRYVFV